MWDKQLKWVDTPALLGILMILLAVTGFFYFSNWGVAWLLICFLIFLAGLAMLFVRFTIVDEGTAKAVMTFGKFSWIIFQWEKHWMDESWTIWREGEFPEMEKDRREDETEEEYNRRMEEIAERARVFCEENESSARGRIFGGLYIYFWPFQKIHTYRNRWTDIRLKEKSEMVVEFHDEHDFDHVLLRPAVYAFQLKAVETKPPERIPVSAMVLVTFRINNPYQFLFIAPPTPVEDILARISAEIRAFVTTHDVDELLQLKGGSIWEKLKEEGRKVKVIEETLPIWGFKLADKGIEIQDIDLPPNYQKAAALRREQEMRAGGRAQEIMGTVISAVSAAEGKEIVQVQEEFRNDPNAFYQKHRMTVDNTMTKLSMEDRAYLRIETPGVTGNVEKTVGDFFLRLIAAWQRMPGGGAPGGRGEKKEKREEMSAERIERFLEKGEEEEEEEETS